MIIQVPRTMAAPMVTTAMVDRCEEIATQLTHAIDNITALDQLNEGNGDGEPYQISEEDFLTLYRVRGNLNRFISTLRMWWDPQ